MSTDGLIKQYQEGVKSPRLLATSDLSHHSLRTRKTTCLPVRRGLIQQVFEILGRYCFTRMKPVWSLFLSRYGPSYRAGFLSWRPDQSPLQRRRPKSSYIRARPFETTIDSSPSRFLYQYRHPVSSSTWVLYPLVKQNVRVCSCDKESSLDIAQCVFQTFPTAATVYSIAWRGNIQEVSFKLVRLRHRCQNLDGPCSPSSGEFLAEFPLDGLRPLL